MIEKQKIELRSDWDYYGASYVIAKYCGLNGPLRRNGSISWQHGWKPSYFNIHPYLVNSSHHSHKKEITFLVAREDQKTYLQSEGYKNVFAIGLPIVYVREQKIQRKANSLLVMPVHSLSYTSHDHWGFEKYANDINNIKECFDGVTVCVHPSCFQKGYWVNEFHKLGFEIIEGASVDDKNALHRLQNILQSHEYVTTNGFGSHIAYASYFGAKVSIFGEYAEYQKADFATDPFYTRYPGILDQSLGLISKEVVSGNLSDLFVFPKDAIERVEWAKNELGYYNRLSPSKLRKMLGWDLTSRIQEKGKQLKDRIENKLRQYF